MNCPTRSIGSVRMLKGPRRSGARSHTHTHDLLITHGRRVIGSLYSMCPLQARTRIKEKLQNTTHSIKYARGSSNPGIRWNSFGRTHDRTSMYAENNASSIYCV